MAGGSIFGEYFKEVRLRLNKSLRQFCMENNFDAGNISKIERGLIPPPGRDYLMKYAKALELKENSEEWIEFFDLASACRGEIPEDILSDEEVLEKLPVFFRSLRGEKVSAEKLRGLIKLIKRS